MTSIIEFNKISSDTNTEYFNLELEFRIQTIFLKKFKNNV